MDDISTKLILDTMNKNFRQINARLDAHDENFKQINAKLEAHDENFKRIDESFNFINAKFRTYDENFKFINRKFDNYDENFKQLNKRFDSQDKKFEELKSEFISLGNTVTRMEKNIGDKAQLGLEYASGAMKHFESITETLNKINSKLDKHDVHIEVLEEKAM